MTRKPARNRVRRIPKGRRINVRRDEFNRVIDILNQRGELLNTMVRNQEIQFQRIAQIQAELDLIQKTRAKIR
jgi:hypothetical protein